MGERGRGDVQCEVASGRQYAQSSSHSLSERIMSSLSEVSSVPSNGRLSAATVRPFGVT
jgi:hypothetical protein